MKPSLQRLLLFGLLAELLILVGSYLLHPELEETFRFAARYSGRLSAIVFLYVFFRYTMTFPKPLKENIELRNSMFLFAALHLIHFGFLATNIYLNEIELVPVRLIGGILAYLMIVLAPFQLYRLRTPFQLVYFYYVSFVMIMTYVARAKGDFEGAAPNWFHFVALVVFLACATIFGIRMWKLRILNNS